MRNKEADFEFVAKGIRSTSLLAAMVVLGTCSEAGDFERHAGVRSEILRISKLYRVNPRVVEALAEVESGLDPAAVSHKGAIGVMQVMPGTGRALRAGDLWSARPNIEAGVRYLRYLGLKFGGDLRLALAAYNAGPGAVTKYRGMPPYMETRAYVKAVIDRYDSLAGTRKASTSAGLNSGAQSLCGGSDEAVDRGGRIVVRAQKLGCNGERLR